MVDCQPSGKTRSQGRDLHPLVGESGATKMPCSLQTSSSWQSEGRFARSYGAESRAVTSSVGFLRVSHCRCQNKASVRSCRSARRGELSEDGRAEGGQGRTGASTSSPSTSVVAAGADMALGEELVRREMGDQREREGTVLVVCRRRLEEFEALLVSTRPTPNSTLLP